YTRGERVRLYFKIDQDAYVTIFRVDTDGRVRVLFPRDPWEDNFARGGRELEVDGRALGSDAFTIDDYPGVGYLFAVASAEPIVPAPTRWCVAGPDVRSMTTYGSVGRAGTWAG